MFGYELPDTALLIRKDGNCWFLATKKKCEFLKPATLQIPTKSPVKSITLLLRNKEDANASNYDTLFKEATSISKTDDETAVLGLILKERGTNSQSGGIVGPWEEKLTAAADGDDATVSLVDVAHGLAFVTAIKDETELDLIKKSSVLSNKVMKHGYVKKMEEVIDSEKPVTHEALAAYVDEILEDPSKISLKVPKDDVGSCYFPIVQSGGTYDLKVSAQSTDANLKHDIILVSLGSRYRNYCSNIARTFFVDPPKKVSETYEVLMEMQEACLAAMKPGNQLKAVYQAAVTFLKERTGFEYLVGHLPKHLGFATGLDFRETSFSLNAKNPTQFKKGMVFCLSVGFQNLELSETDLSSTPEKSAVSSVVASIGLLCPGTLNSGTATRLTHSFLSCCYCRSKSYRRMLFLFPTWSPLQRILLT